MGPTWVLSAPGGPHVGPIDLVIRVRFQRYLLHTLCCHIFAASVLPRGCFHTETWTKWPLFCRRHFQMYPLEWKLMYFYQKLHNVCSWGSNWWYIRICSGKSLEMVRQQDIVGPNTRWAIGGRWLQSPASQHGDGGKPAFKEGHFWQCYRAWIVAIFGMRVGIGHS